jgi:hypothetical protein
MRFYGHIPNPPRNKNPKRHISYLLENVVFLDPRRLLSPLAVGEKNFFVNFKHYDLTNLKNECVRFGGPVDIEVSYKILRLIVLKETPILYNLSCFE